MENKALEDKSMPQKIEDAPRGRGLALAAGPEPSASDFLDTMPSASASREKDELDALRALEAFGQIAESLAWSAVAGRFEETRRKIGTVDWIGAQRAARAKVESSVGEELYDVEVEVRASSQKGLGETELSTEFWTTPGWSGFGRCSCPFAEKNGAMCKHIGALAQEVGSMAGSRAERLALERSTGSGAQSAPARRARI